MHVLTQLQWKLVASATQALYKCLTSANVCILNDGGSESVHVHIN